MTTNHIAKKEEATKGAFLLLVYLTGLGFLVNLTASNPVLGQRLTTGLMGVGIIYVLVYLARTWIRTDRGTEAGD